ncbi:MAG: RNA polymerase sigma-70 factor [Chitinophagaceae bacterium]|nr:RNA polymerase sigma-70 factor [Chitinophagaceae bacterium]
MQKDNLHNEKMLFRQISAGDEQAFRSIFYLYKTQLFKVAIRLTKSKIVAEEIIQEVFLSLWVSREHLVKVEQPSSYLYRTLFNKVSSYLKKEANQERIIKAAMQAGQPASDPVRQLVEEHDTQRLIEQALVKLPSQQNIVYRLSRQQGLSNDEIASHLHVSQNTVKSHLSKAIWFIRTYLKNLAVVLLFLKDL